MTTPSPHPFVATNPVTGELLPGSWPATTFEELEIMGELAAGAPMLTQDERVALLNRIADRLDENKQQLAERAHLETALPMPRLLGEVGRTTAQLRMFANLLDEGSWVDARIDTALPDRQPAPRPDLRRMLMPIGPVAVFGASNFPFAFSVAGGDTASALAAGNPVIVKAHPAHIGTCVAVGELISEALRDLSLPSSLFQLAIGGAEIGEALVKHPQIKAVAFTGSTKVGTHLFNLGNQRPEPIPVYAEMGSVNPVFALPGLLKKDAVHYAQQYADSVTLGVGQFCTKPGFVFGIESPEWRQFVEVASEKISGFVGTMLTPGIASAYKSVVTNCPHEGAMVSGELVHLDAEPFIRNREMHREVFGPYAIAVTCSSLGDFLRCLAAMEGQLTATILHGEGDEDLAGALLPKLTAKVGRVVFNRFPTGVEVVPSMTHGGPFPATSIPNSTSVGTAAILRFVRPVTFQDAPDELLPPELRMKNPLGIQRLVNGALTHSEG